MFSSSRLLQALTVSQTEQFIDGLFPKKDPKAGEKEVVKRVETPESKAAAEEAKWDLSEYHAA